MLIKLDCDKVISMCEDWIDYYASQEAREEDHIDEEDVYEVNTIQLTVETALENEAKSVLLSDHEFSLLTECQYED